MNTHANFAKNKILEIIEEMSTFPETFSLVGKTFCSRKKIWDFPTIVKFILSFGSNSLGHEIGEFFQYRKGFPTVSSFVQQRQKLSYTALEYLFTEFTKHISVNPTLFNGYRLIAIDGSDLVFPYNPSENNVMLGDHVSAVHLNGIYDVCSKMFLDVSITENNKKNECGAACELIDRITDKYPAIFIADRAYENYNLFAHIEERMFDYVIRVKDSGNACMVAGMNLPVAEEYDITKHIVITRKSTGPALVNREKYKYLTKQARFDYIADSKSDDYEMSIRFVRFKLAENKYEILATSLSEDTFTAEDLKEIYRLRWGIETSFRELKYILGLSAFHSKKANSILQEVFSRLIMYNFSMFITQKVELKEKDRSYQLQVNFTQAIKICLNYFRHRGNEPPYNIEATIQRFLLPIRPNRKHSRECVSTTVVSFNYRLA